MQLLQNYVKIEFYESLDNGQCVFKLYGVSSLIADPFLCNSTDRQNPSIQLMFNNSLTNDALNLFTKISFMTKSTISNRKGSNRKGSAPP